MVENGFATIYPFATENVKGYFERMDLKGKSVLTVGSSLDQTFNAIVLGAKKITVFDISPKTVEFFKIKRDIILSHERKDLYKILTTKQLRKDLKETQNISLSKDMLKGEQVYSVNNYLESEYKYQLLKKLLKEVDIEFITGDIFKIDETLKGKYDRIIFSNILQYLEYYFSGEDVFEILKNNFEKWKEYLNDDGIMQLLYLYLYTYEDVYKENHAIAVYNLKKVVSALKGYKLDIEWIDGVVSDKNDAIVTYKKRK